MSLMPLDVTDRASADTLAIKVESQFGRLDVLVNAAGWDIIQPFMENTPEYWDKNRGTQLHGTGTSTRALLPLLFASGSGRIVNIASDAGRVGCLRRDGLCRSKGRHHRLHQVACPAKWCARMYGSTVCVRDQPTRRSSPHIRRRCGMRSSTPAR